MTNTFSPIWIEELRRLEDAVPPRSTETVLQKRWLNKPLKAGLVLPALKAYMSGQWQADLNRLQLTILVDGLEVDGTAPGSAYVRVDGVVTTVAIAAAKINAVAMGVDCHKR